MNSTWIKGTHWCSNEAITERKSTKCLHFSYLNLNDLETTIKVTGKQLSTFFMQVIHPSV